MSTEQLLALLQQSLTNNASSGITGMLLYGNETFLQALEGEEQVVDDLYHKIAKDPRHNDIRLLYRRTIQARQYSDWCMGFKRVSDKELQNIKGLKGFSEKDFTAGYLIEHAAVAETLMDHYRTPYWEPLVREIDEKEQIIRGLKKTIANTKSCAEIATLVLESITTAGRTGSLTESHLRLCDFALDALRQIEVPAPKA